MTDNCKDCGLAYNPGFHPLVHCLAKQVVNLRDERDDLQAKLAETQSRLDSSRSEWRGQVQIALDMAKRADIAEAKLDSARESFELIAMKSHKDFRNKDTDYHNKLALNALAELGTPAKPVTDTTKLGECAEPYHYYRADQKRGTCSCAALTEKEWDVCRCGARFHLKDSPSGVCPDCRDQTAKDDKV